MRYQAIVYVAAILMSVSNLQNQDYPEVAAWVYVDSPLVPGGWYGFPPLALWVGIGVFVFSAVDVRIDEVAAIRGARGHKIGILRGPERQSVRDARENLKCQLRARGHAGLFASGRGMIVSLGLGIVGVGVVLVTSLFTPTTSRSRVWRSRESRRALSLSCVWWPALSPWSACCSVGPMGVVSWLLWIRRAT